MCHRLKPLGQLLHGQFGLSLSLQLGQFPQYLAATQSTQHRLSCLQETAREVGAYKLCLIRCQYSILLGRIEVYCRHSSEPDCTKKLDYFKHVSASEDLPSPRRKWPFRCGSEGRPKWREKPRGRGSALSDTSSHHAAAYWHAGVHEEMGRGY